MIAVFRASSTLADLHSGVMIIRRFCNPDNVALHDNRVQRSCILADLHVSAIQGWNDSQVRTRGGGGGGGGGGRGGVALRIWVAMFGNPSGSVCNSVLLRMIQIMPAPMHVKLNTSECCD